MDGSYWLFVKMKGNGGKTMSASNEVAVLAADVKGKMINIVGEENFDDSKTGRLVYSYDATPNFSITAC